ncbi:phosphate signaling complex protein PhoU [candidate division WOR-3 bacterium]|nr:phosphate signaling complex protein PhoU [candidate division WOR-3 bacterium]
MTILEQKLADLKEQLLSMAATAEEMVAASMKALVERDEALARRVIEADEPRVNRLEIENEDTAINIMALHQPEASNLRTLAMVIKINNDLERIGDHAVNIAEAALFLIPRPAVKPLVDLPRMAALAVAMLKDSLDAFTRADAELARRVCGRDSAVDDLKNLINAELAQYMSADPTTVERALKLMMISLNLERIADLATNVSEDVIYIVKGEDIKHGNGRPVA